MMNLQESENVLILIREDKSKLFYDMFGLVSFLFLGLFLIHPHKSLNLTGDELMSGWFTAIGGIIFCFFLILTNEHTSKWTFDKKLFRFIVEYQGLFGCRSFEFPLEQIKSVKVIHSSTGSAQIMLPDLKPVPISMGKIPVERVSNYARAIVNFLGLSDSSL